MPMGKAALKDQGAPPPLPAFLPPPPAGAAPMPPPPLPQAGPLPPPPVAAPPMAPAAPAVPWKVKQQPDGSSVDYIPSPDGNPANDVILNVHQAPKIPKALQGPSQPQGQ